MATNQDKKEFVNVLVKEFNQPEGEALNVANKLQKLIRLHESWMLEKCNVPVDEDVWNKKVDDIRKKISDILFSVGVKQIEFNSDPRGFTVYIQTPNQYSNSFAGREAGWGIGGFRNS